MKAKAITRIALMTALMCVFAPLSVPIGPVPISLTGLTVYLCSIILGGKYATISYCIYYLLGIVGLPVFSNYTGGIAKALSPTGGFLFGYIIVALVCGITADKTSKKPIQFLAMLCSTVVLYILGSAWYCIVTKSDLGNAFTVCVAPFIAVDIIKMIIALYLGNEVKKRISPLK